jgi:hypothetical protein
VHKLSYECPDELLPERLFQPGQPGKTDAVNVGCVVCTNVLPCQCCL